MQAVFRSINGGTTSTTVTDPAHQYGGLNVIAGDPKVFGRVSLGTSGVIVVYSAI